MRHDLTAEAAWVSASGELVTLGEQDRAAWDAALVAEGHRLVRQRLATGQALGRRQESRAAYDRAIALAGNAAETAYLTRRRDQLGGCPDGQAGS